MPALVCQGAGRLAYEEVPVGPPGPDEVVVDLRFAGVNPLDVRICRGLLDRGLRLPLVPGTEATGTVGGRPVVVYGAGVGTRRAGTFTSRAVVPKTAVHPVPEGFDPLQAAALGTAGVTAWSLLNTVARVGPDDGVLVLGAGGGVGTVAVQLALAAGARVWAQTAHAEKAGRLGGMGAEQVLVSSPEELAPALGSARPSLVLDALGGDYTGAALRCLDDGGKIVVYGTSAAAEGRIDLRALYRGRARIEGYASMVEPPAHVAHAITELVRMIDEGVVTIPIHGVVPLKRAEDAFAALESRGVFGKILLELS